MAINEITVHVTPDDLADVFEEIANNLTDIRKQIGSLTTLWNTVEHRLNALEELPGVREALAARPAPRPAEGDK